MVKFRTMRLDAEADGVAQLSAEGDPRVIPACRWVRATRADELPQILHILAGKMSVVGPRPERPELTAGFEGDRGLHPPARGAPGLTGLAQIHGRYHTDAEYKLGYDLQYLVNWSPCSTSRSSRARSGSSSPGGSDRRATDGIPAAAGRVAT